jgi:Fe-S cluster biogenesis protein NfuA
MFIETEPTPNPDTLKFIPGRPVTGSAPPVDFDSAEGAAANRLAASIFGIRGVTRVFFGSDFLSVTKAGRTDWAHVTPLVLAAVMDHYVAGLPVLDGDEGSVGAAVPEAAQDSEGDPLVAEILELIETRVRPAVAQDGGDIVFQRFDRGSGVVYLHLRGACSGCPSSSLTLKQGIQNLLRTYIPEVTGVEAVL